LNAKQEYIRARRDHWTRISLAGETDRKPSRSYRKCLSRIFRNLAAPQHSVLELGCGRGDLLAALQPARGVGVDFCPEKIDEAREKYPEIEFVCSEVSVFECSEKIDFVILSDILSDVWDIQDLFSQMKNWCHPRTRIILNSYSRVWQLPVIIARKLGLATPMPEQNWLTRDDLINLLHLEGYEEISFNGEILIPFDIPILQNLCNRYLARIFPLKYLALTDVIVARPSGPIISDDALVSVVVPARNEQGNIRHIFDRIPQIGGGVELIFVEGGSTDGTYAAIENEISARPDIDAVLFKQAGTGKGDAVRKGFAEARGEVLMILDADLTVSPEELPRFFRTLANGRAEFVNGVRLVYPQEDEAMRFLNFLGNKFFSLAFSWLLNRPIKDTLCGTKVLTKYDYERISANREYFGDFDPFGDFDLIFGAVKLSLKFADLPVHYGERNYGETNISRWSHGLLLIKMFFFALRKIKFT